MYEIVLRKNFVLELLCFVIEFFKYNLFFVLFFNWFGVFLKLLIKIIMLFDMFIFWIF